MYYIFTSTGLRYSLDEVRLRHPQVSIPDGADLAALGYAPAPAPSWADVALDPRYFWIDVGPFFDRFGAKALAITGSTDPQVQGLVTLLLPRKYVDLKRADLPSMMDLLVAKGLINNDDKTAVLNPQTTDYERHVKGMVQPA